MNLKEFRIQCLFLREAFPPDHKVRQLKSRPMPVHASHSASADAAISASSKSRVSLGPHDTASESQQVSTVEGSSVHCNSSDVEDSTSLPIPPVPSADIKVPYSQPMKCP